LNSGAGVTGEDDLLFAAMVQIEGDGHDGHGGRAALQRGAEEGEDFFGLLLPGVFGEQGAEAHEVEAASEFGEGSAPS
jgi:hypothetical protein